MLSGNRNFEGRIHPDVRMNYLASPPLVVAYALAGTMNIDLATEPLGCHAGRPARLPGRPMALQRRRSPEVLEQAVGAEMFRREYAEATTGDEQWRSLEVPTGQRYAWERAVDLRAETAVSRGNASRAGADHRRHRRPGAGGPR